MLIHPLERSNDQKSKVFIKTPFIGSAIVIALISDVNIAFF